jgi:hypothetical protein
MADNDELMKSIIQFIITFFVLLIINAVVSSLPGIHTTIPGMYWWSVAGMISAIISLVMIIVVWRFGVTVSPLVQKKFPKITDARTIVMYATYLVCLIIAYGALRSLVYSFSYNFAWLYDLAFLLIGLYLVYVLGTLLMKNSDKLTDVIVSDVQQATGAKKTCKKCGTENPLANNFCDKCGNRLE